MEEIEVRFLEIDVDDLIQQLEKLGAQKNSDSQFDEWVYVRPEWDDISGRVRIRSDGQKSQIAYKETRQGTDKGNVEIEFEVSDPDRAVKFMDKMGLEFKRHQQKRRIAYHLDGVSIDIDFWPKIPPYVEIEAVSLKEIEKTAKKLGLEMENACTLDAMQVIRQIYKIELKGVREFTFD